MLGSGWGWLPLVTRPPPQHVGLDYHVEFCRSSSNSVSVHVRRCTVTPCRAFRYKLDDTDKKCGLQFAFTVQTAQNLVSWFSEKKIIKIVASRCPILRLKCTKLDFGWGAAPDPAEGAYSTPRPLVGFRGHTSKGRGRRGEGRKREGRKGDKREGG